MGFWIFKSAREKALDQISKRLGGIETIINEEVEDSDIGEVLDRIERIERILAGPQQEQKAGGQSVIPPDVVNALLGLVPNEYRFLAERVANGFLKDPGQVKKTIETLTNNPAIQKFIKGTPTQTAPANVAQSLMPPPDYLQPYDPSRRRE